MSERRIGIDESPVAESEDAGPGRASAYSAASIGVIGFSAFAL